MLIFDAILTIMFSNQYTCKTLKLIARLDQEWVVSEHFFIVSFTKRILDKETTGINDTCPNIATGTLEFMSCSIDFRKVLLINCWNKLFERGIKRCLQEFFKQFKVQISFDTYTVQCFLHVNWLCNVELGEFMHI